MTGKKRASPGVDEEKNPLQSVELGDEDAQKLQDIQRDIARAELIMERRAFEMMLPIYEKRRVVVKAIDKFWPVALMNNNAFQFHAQHKVDMSALSYLEDLWITRDPVEPRCFTIEFHFKENPFFSNPVLKKQFKYVPSPVAANEKPDGHGITNSMVNFSWARDVEPQGTVIHWKDPEQALTKLHPQENLDDDDEMPADSGSFFHFFEQAADPFDIGLAIANEVFPECIDFFLGNAGGDEDDSEEEDSEDDDDEAEEIDLEKPKSKRQKHA